ncbi:sulfite exporter TauE/SafE family protein [Bacteroidota bacterium]
MEYLITALTLGFIGSAHCAGMCGPIALALPLNRKNLWTRISGSLVYNLGKIITYGILGLVFGLFGQGLLMAGFQQWVSILLGIIMILSVFFPILFKNKAVIDKLIQRFVAGFASKLRSLFVIYSYPSLFIIGLLNGLLPCGLVYIAIAGAIGTGNYIMGGLSMLFFGIGTAPMLIGISFLGSTISNSFRKWMNKLIPVVVIVIGVLFILRGLNLGIPYVSPKSQMLSPAIQDADSSDQHNCH